MPLSENEIFIADTYAEAFGMKFARLIVTAADQHWLQTAGQAFCGYATSVIGCDAEVGIELKLSRDQTPDGRDGISILAFGFSSDALGEAVMNRVGQCLMTCPTTAVYDGLAESEKRISLGEKLRYFGDGFQKSKVLADQRFWRIPVMDGEFVVAESVGTGKGVAGGNFIIQSADQSSGLTAARTAIDAISKVDGVITPFPGGVVRSGSKVGSKYKALRASTNEAFCPTLRGRVDSQLVEGANITYEIVIDGVSEEAVAQSMQIGIKAACSENILAISAGNYGGQLGKFHFHLRQLLA